MSSSSSAVKVIIRTRPTASFASDNIYVDKGSSRITVRMPKMGNPNSQDSWSWQFDAVMHNASQESMYYDQIAPAVQSVLSGYNGSILCYGQTGAGKTFTTMGDTRASSFQNRGIVPRALADIFGYINDRPHLEATVKVSYVEIYQDQLIDLLSTLPSEEPPAEGLSIVEEKGDVRVKNLKTEVVTSEEEALAMLFEGTQNRSTAQHQLNKHSTRGHAIFTVHIRIRSRVDSSGTVTKCKLNLVDLAGSERLKKTGTDGVLRDESMYINRSLTFLEQVVVALGSKGRAHTPYRQSKLTHLLKDSLGGNCKTLLIANIYGDPQHLEETISTLQFAARVQKVPNEASLNLQVDPETLLRKYAMELQDLKRELSMHNALAERSCVVYEPYSDTQRIKLMEELSGYLESADPATGIALESVRQMRELLSGMKSLYGEQSAKLDQLLKQQAAGGPIGAGMSQSGDASGGAPGDAGDADAGEEVGDLVLSSTRGIAIGAAMNGARPMGGLVEPPAYQRDFVPESSDFDPTATSVAAADPAKESAMSRDEAFLQFKISEGKAANERLVKAKRGLKEMKQGRLDAAATCNAMKSKIDQCAAALQAKRTERMAAMAASPGSEEDEHDVIIDEEEYNLLQEHKSSKRAYKASYDKMKASKAREGELATEIDAHRVALVEEFQQWYLESFNQTAELFDIAPAAPTDDGNKEVMDDDEQFESMQMAKVMAEEPDSLAFVRARMNTNSHKKGGARKG